MADDQLVLVEEPEVSEFVQQQYVQGANGVIPELPEDFVLIKDGHRSREF